MLCSCGLSVERGRESIGLTTCRSCGDREANRQISEMRGRVFQTHNKGGFSVASRESFQRTMLDAGRKDSAQQTYVVNTNVSRRSTTAAVATRRPIGAAWVDGDCVAIFERDDPRLERATRYVFYSR